MNALQTRRIERSAAIIAELRRSVAFAPCPIELLSAGRLAS
ncbi:hypothetical protein [Haliangium sp. UPWRP_2]|nr:hypothetical protein [Haliangium sp. UPWRP_2]